MRLYRLFTDLPEIWVQKIKFLGASRFDWVRFIATVKQGRVGQGLVARPSRLRKLWEGGVYVVHRSRYTVTTVGNIGRSRGRSRYKAVTKPLQAVTK